MPAPPSGNHLVGGPALHWTAEISRVRRAFVAFVPLVPFAARSTPPEIVAARSAVILAQPNPTPPPFL
jgi:hypothetical protein